MASASWKASIRPLCQSEKSRASSSSAADNSALCAAAATARASRFSSLVNPRAVTRSASRSPSDSERFDLLAEFRDVAQLDVLVSADHIGQRGQLHRLLIALGREPGQRLLDQRAVLADQRALDAPHFGATERIERRPAQAAHRIEHAERGVEPRSDLDLLLHAQRAEQRRMEVVLDLHTAGKLV